jgi:hypothetical protein
MDEEATKLSEAIKNGTSETVLEQIPEEKRKELINHLVFYENFEKKLIDYPSVSGYYISALGIAIIYQKKEIVEMLLEHGADINVLTTLIDHKKQSLKGIETSFIWKWVHSNDEAEKERLINDFVEIQSGEVIDLGLEIDVVVDRNELESDVIKSIIEKTISYFAIEKRKMGDPLFTGELLKEIGSTSGVVNVVDVRVFNKTGGEYSQAEVSQSYKTPETKEILQADMTVYMKSNQIFQIRFPNKDIKVRVKPLTSTTF